LQIGCFGIHGERSTRKLDLTGLLLGAKAAGANPTVDA
jgi:hypothetical protein